MTSNSEQNHLYSSRIESDYGRSGMPRLRLYHSSGSSLEIYFYGAHITSWKSGGEELLFMSEKTIFEVGKPIRGGIPLVFPQFGLGPMPAHGFARTSEWKESHHEVRPEGSVSLTLKLITTSEIEKLWPVNFEVELEIVLNESLSTTLRVKNNDSKPIEFQNAFHTYFAITNISTCSIEDLSGKKFLDSTKDRAEGLEEREIITFIQETDRIYLESPNVVTITDPSHKRVFRIEKSGMNDSVVWNPWIDRCKAIADLEDDAYLRYVCVEPGNVKNPIVVKPGSQWEGTQTLSVNSLSPLKDCSNANRKS